MGARVLRPVRPRLIAVTVRWSCFSDNKRFFMYRVSVSTLSIRRKTYASLVVDTRYYFFLISGQFLGDDSIIRVWYVLLNYFSDKFY